jgi:NAD(P)-dependent dehydrogenase (short-subunit alcohol dehydrogenase family)
MQLDKGISAVITGGASGLGAATARALTAKGVKVAILDVNADAGERLAGELGGTFARCDVTKEASVDAALTAARAAVGQERILVNCAGIGIAKRITRRVKETNAIEPHDLSSFTRVIEVNLIGTFLMTAKCAAGMQGAQPVGPDGERGVVICTSSVAAEDGQIGQVAYSASKGGVAAMTLPVARDLARDGVRVVTIMPGLFLTPMFAGLSDDAQKSLAASVPFPARLGRPDEYAALAVHICENTMLNGVCIRLDGALRMAPR